MGFGKIFIATHNDAEIALCDFIEIHDRDCYIGAASKYTFKNLTVKMASADAVATHDEMISLFGEHNSLVAAELTFENCNFDVKYEILKAGKNSAAAVLLSRHRSTKPSTINVTNCTFKMDAKVQNGAHGALLGRRWNAVPLMGMVTFNINGCTFDVKYDTSAALAPEAEGYNLVCAAVLGNYDSDGSPNVSKIVATGTNTVHQIFAFADSEVGRKPGGLFDHRT